MVLMRQSFVAILPWLHFCWTFQHPVPTVKSARLARSSGHHFRSCLPKVYGQTVQRKSINGDGERRDTTEKPQIGDFSCRVVALADGKVPNNETLLPTYLRENPQLLTQLDSLYHSISRAETRLLMDLEKTDVNRSSRDDKLVSVLRTSLEDAGFELLTKRDLDLCEALNAGYLLRLSILPNTAELDPGIGKEFYPEIYTRNRTVTDDDLLFGGRILIYRRGYSSETSKGKLLLPKLDYLQASLVQRSASTVTKSLGQFERKIIRLLAMSFRTINALTKEFLANLAELLPSKSIARFLKDRWGWRQMTQEEIEEQMLSASKQQNLVFKLGRYGGSKIKFVGSPDISDALTPFLICEVNEGLESEDGSVRVLESPYNGDVDHDIMTGLNSGDFTCQYDAENPSYRWRSQNPIPPVLLERVTLGNVVDLYSEVGRDRVAAGFVSESKLIEPTYEEVIAIWRTLPKQQRRRIAPPKLLYDIAEIFDMEDKLPKKPEPMPEPDPSQLEIRTFDDVPMANLPAVFPKTRLVLRPADALLFDLISVFTFLIVLGSQRFDNPKLDLIAIVSVTLWVIRTIIRYSNKLARYDLLVKNFLSSKISHRGQGAVRYIVDEAGSQRALRVALLYLWVLRESKKQQLTRSTVLAEGFRGMNKLLRTNRLVDFDVEAGLNDLEDLGLVALTEDKETIDSVVSEEEASRKLKETWDDVFEGNVSLRTLVGRRKRQISL